MAVFKWIVDAQKMVFMLDSLLTEWACKELLSHQMIGSTLAWWQDVDASLTA